MKAGAARAVITPPVGTELSGWAFGPSVGIHDDLYAKALVLVGDEPGGAGAGGDGRPVVFITADLIGLDVPYADRIRAQVAADLSTDVDRVMVSCSHTHSGPGTMHIRHWGEVDEAYAEVAVKHLIGVARMAAARLEPARIGFARAGVEGIAVNRRDEGAVDDSLVVGKVETENGSLTAVLWNFSCHPVAAHNYRNVISADYPGFAARVVESTHAGAVSLFTLGAAGDINPAEFHHMRHAERYGTMLGGAILTVLGTTETRADADIAVAAERLDLPVKPFPERRELESEIEEHSARLRELESGGADRSKISNVRIKLDWARDALRAVDSGGAPPTRSMDLHCIRINESVFVGLPGELFSRIGLSIKKASSFEPTVIVELANGSLCYLPTKDAFERGGYEIDFSAKVYGLYMLTGEAEAVILGGAQRLLSRVV